MHTFLKNVSQKRITILEAEANKMLFLGLDEIKYMYAHSIWSYIAFMVH